jgi:hypothetical protein
MELRPLKLSLDLQHDPRVIPIKQQLLQDYFSRTQTARPDFTTDAKVLKVPATQLRQQLNSLTFGNSKKREYLRRLRETHDSTAIDLNSVVSFENLVQTRTLPCAPLHVEQVEDVSGQLNAQIAVMEDKLETEEFTESQLRHMILTATQNILFLIQTQLKERVEGLQEYHKRLFSRMDEIVILKHKAENKATSSTHHLLKGSEEVESQRTKRESRLQSVRQSATSLIEEYEECSTALAKRLILKSVM